MTVAASNSNVNQDLNADYSPISCTFHDRLEDYSIRGSLLPVRYLENGELVETQARIADVFAKDGADFAKLTLTDKTEVLVRLDRLLSVNGFELPTVC